MNHNLPEVSTDRLTIDVQKIAAQLLQQAGLGAPQSHDSTLPLPDASGPDFTISDQIPAPLHFSPQPSSAMGAAQFVSLLHNTSRPAANHGLPSHSLETLLPQLLRKAVHTAPANLHFRPFNPTDIRRDFPILQQQVHGKPLVWLDNAATTQKPRSVIDAVSHFYLHDNSNIHRAAHSLAARATDAWEAARDRVKQFLGAASSEEIVFVRGTTEAINLVARTAGSISLRPGDEIVLTVLEHHANIVPWQMVARETGAVIKVAPVDDRGEIQLDAYEALLGPRTKFVALTHASNSLGTILPVERMTAAAKRHNALVLIDGAQSVSHMPVNVQQIGCDFYVFSGHKLYAPTGIGAVYMRREIQQTLPPWQGGGNMIRTVSFDHTTYNDPPARFEAGTPSIADAVGLHAAIDYISAVGWPAIQHHEHQLLEYAIMRLRSVPGLRMIGNPRHRVGVLSLVLPGLEPEKTGQLLDQQGIAVRAGHHCAQPSLQRFNLTATVRPSFGLYNTHNDIDRLTDALIQITAQHTRLR